MAAPPPPLTGSFHCNDKCLGNGMLQYDGKNYQDYVLVDHNPNASVNQLIITRISETAGRFSSSEDGLIAFHTWNVFLMKLNNIVNEAALLAARRGGEAVSREDIMEAIERAKFGINNKTSPSMISKELGKLFPWMPSLMGKSDSKTDGFQGPLGYQSLSS